MWHVVSGGVQLPVSAETVEDACVEAIKQCSLDQFDRLICVYEDGTSFEDGTTSWGFTEWYLPRAGYEEIEPRLWRRRQDPDESSSGASGSNQMKGINAPTSPPSPQESISETVYIVPSKQDGKPKGKALERRRTRDSLKGSKEKASTSHPIQQVNVERTPEEWAAIVAEAKNNKQLSDTGLEVRCEPITALLLRIGSTPNAPN
jgi:hypothetical protein